ncbi:MAG: hypothetical protein ACE5GV_17795 [Candidatus Scalindua sp.]
MGNFSIRVMKTNGQPAKGVRVSVDFGMWSGQSKEYTDSSGWAEFSNLDGKLVTGKIFINGVSQGDYRTHSGNSHSFTIDW